VYVVQRGDTLYSIAFRYGMDYRKMAAANRIPAPYTIYPGQKLYLKEAAVVPGSAARPPPAPSSPVAQPPAPKKPSPSGSATTTTTAVTKPSSSAATVASPKTEAAPVSTAVDGWRWPTSGRVVRGYSSSVHKGIDIAGRRGDPIYAVANGTVVYAGTGIVGMGELLIVKHNEVYLSAYAHNDRLLVGEGERVRAGQKIATKGNSGTDEVKLHFEIRKAGKPVDPARLLPRR
jgi:lipoprotein NlpD